MGELACPSSSCSPHSPASSSFAASGRHHPVLEFESCDVPELWLEDDEGLDGAVCGDGGSPPSAGNNLSDKQPAPAAKRRGRNPGPRTHGPVISHVEAERQRRDKLNRRFWDLRAAVPTVSKMDMASLLADAAAYIAELRGRVELLEIEAKQAAAGKGATNAGPGSSSSGDLEETLEVRMCGSQAAALRLTTAARHAPARLMAALFSLDLPVQHACVCRVGGGLTVQDAVVGVPAALRDEGRLRAALLHRMHGSAASS